MNPLGPLEDVLWAGLAIIGILLATARIGRARDE